MSKALVSILVPLHNKRDHVASTLASALGQTYTNIEVIVLDDGSTDDSLSEVQSIEDPRLRIVHREQRGANATRNELISMARGDFVQFLDADDHLDPRKIEIQTALYEPGVDIVFCGYRRVAAAEVTINCAPPRAAHLLEDLVERGPVTIVPLHRRSLLVEVGGFDESLLASQEYELHLRSLLSGLWRSVRVTTETLATYHDVANSVSSAECSVYQEKERAIRKLLPLADSPAKRAVLGMALMNTARHLARCGSESTVSAIRAARLASSRSVEALPRRHRHLVRIPNVLARVEWAEDQVRRRLSSAAARSGDAA